MTDRGANQLSRMTKSLEAAAARSLQQQLWN
jgi:hypothetical protein